MLVLLSMPILAPLIADALITKAVELVSTLSREARSDGAMNTDPASRSLTTPMEDRPGGSGYSSIIWTRT